MPGNWTRFFLAGTSLVITLLCCACGGGTASPGPPAPPAGSGSDDTAPAITSVNGARDGSALLRSVALSATASDNHAVTSFELALDGTVIHAVGSGQLDYTLDTERYAPGPHKLLLTARDAAGNAGWMELRVTFLRAGPGTSLPLPPPQDGSDNPAAPPSEPLDFELPDVPTSVAFIPGALDEQGLPLLDLSNPPVPEDTEPPSGVLFASFKPNQVVWGYELCVVVVNDNSGIWLLEAWFGDELIGNVSNNFGLTERFDTRLAPDGVQLLTIRAVDYGGNVGIAQLPLNVQNTTHVDTRRPIYLGDFPLDQPGLRGDVLLKPKVFEKTALGNSKLYINTVEVYSGDSQEPQFLWRTTDYPDGVYQLLFEISDISENTLRLYSYAEVTNGSPTYSVSGRLLAPNGKDPLPGFSVRIPRRAAGEWFAETGWHTTYSSVARRASQGTTDAAGKFSLSGVLPGPCRLQADRLLWSDMNRPCWLELELDVQGNLTLGTAQCTLDPAGPAMPRITVVTGDGEALPDWLAKCGFGKTDAGGRLIPGTEQFLLVDGNNSLPDGQHFNFPQFMDIPALLDNTDVLLIAAGTHYEEQFIASPGWVSRLRDWSGSRRNGDDSGKRRVLYCGGSSYDYLEQSSPGAFNFGALYPEQHDPDSPEQHSAAEGRSALPSNRARWESHPRSTDLSDVLLPWLHVMGYGQMQQGAEFELPLAAGWIGAVWQARTDWDHITGTHTLYYPSSLLSCDYLSEPADPEDQRRMVLLGQSPGSGAWFNGLPVPAQPAPQWTLQERLLEYLLFKQWL